MDRLIVKNFGPLKDIDIKLNKINLFIGENGSGKSILAKLISILTSFEFEDIEGFLKKLKSFQIENNLNSKSYIKCYFGKDYIEFKDKTLFFSKEFEILFKALKLKEKTVQILENTAKIMKDVFKDEANELKQINKDFQEVLSEKEKVDKLVSSQYIPAERNLISIFNQSIYSFLTAEIPIPKFLISFFSEFEKARKTIKELDFLNVKYKYTDKIEIYYNKNEFLELENSSSGIQSALPLYLTVKYFSQKHKNIIIEEPEQNLFPKSQKETIEYIIEQLEENSLFLMTHSPYVLSALNILMMAYKAGNLGKEAEDRVLQYCSKKKWINPSEFSAYYLETGKVRDIKGKTGLISENEIDNISDEIQDEFEELLSIYRKYKNVK